MSKKKKQTNIIGIVYFILLLAAGFYIGARFSKEAQKENISLIVGLIYFYVVFLLTFLISVVLHELGHLLFGILTGYKFVYFRIGSLALVKYDNEGFKFKKQYMPGTAGQCILAPPDKKDGNYPKFLYHAGGLIVNVIMAIISYLIFKNTETLLVRFIANVNMIINIIIFLTNAIPINGNDGFNILELNKSKVYSDLAYDVLFFEYLKINNDKRYENFEFTKIPDEGVFRQYVDVVELEKKLFARDYEAFKNIFQSVINTPGLNPIYEFAMAFDNMYVDTLLEKKDTFFQEFKKNKLYNNMLKGTKNTLFRKRFDVMYYSVVEKDQEKLDEAVKEFKDAARNELSLSSLEEEWREVGNFVDLG